MDSFLVDNALNIWLLAHSCAVVLAHTQGVGPAPRGWSDHFLASQTVSVNIDETICGKPIASPTLDLSLPVVQGSRIASSTPSLAPWITKVGSRVLYFLEDGQVRDEDIGALSADAELVRWVRGLCSGPVPPGVPGLLYLLSQTAESDDAIKRIFASLSPVVVDFVDSNGKATRLTVLNGKLRVFSGIRFLRVAGSRRPDLILHGSASDLGKVLTGRLSAKGLAIAEGNFEFMEALDKAGQVIGANVDRAANVRAAAYDVSRR